jgi:hypothetical protein
LADRHGQLAADKGRLYVSRHVVTALTGVDKRHIFRTDPVYGRFQINPHVWISILIDADRSRCVLEKEV